ncbi:MAG: hypothetical protein ACXWPM_01085 [Bdellovibrionota bacterium]
MLAARALPEFLDGPTTPPMESVGKPPEKPSLDEVLAYATKQADKYVRDLAAHLPPEQQEEICQEALVRIFKAYDKIDPKRGWRTFVQEHCWGAAQDYKRDGKGFRETRWDEPGKDEAAEDEAELEAAKSAALETAQEPQESNPDVASPSAPKERRLFKQRLSHRVSIVSSEDDQVLDVESVAGIFGVHSQSENEGPSKVRWNLVARMASVDREIHLVAKMIRGFSETDLAPGFRVTREMLSQRFYAFIEKLDSPEFYHSPWIAQTIYAFGLSEQYGMPDHDQGLGWNYEPVDLDSKDSLALMSLFDQLEFEF